MNTRIYNARILSMVKDMEIISGEIWVEENRITHVGTVTKPREVQWDREINAKQNLIMPGFKNAHTHSPMTFLRSYADDLPLLEWLDKQVFPMEAKLTEEQAYWCTKLAVMEYLTSGITSCFDMYFHVPVVAKAFVDCGFRAVLVSGMNDFSSSVEEMESYYNRFNNYHELISFKLGFHAEYTNSENNLKAIAELAKKYQAPVYTHNAETKEETDGCIERHGTTPTSYLDSLGVFDYGGGGYHCVHLTEEDMDIFKKRNMSVVTNSGSNVKLASGIADITRMMEKGINISIGTDGPASNNCLDMFREMFLVTGLAKLREQDAAAVPADKVLEMAAKGGAETMGLSECDSLEVGKLADLIMIDLHQPNMQPIHNIVKNLVYSGSKSDVALTMVNGKILYEEGEFFIGSSTEEVYDYVSNMSLFEA